MSKKYTFILVKIEAMLAKRGKRLFFCNRFRTVKKSLDRFLHNLNQTAGYEVND